MGAVIRVSYTVRGASRHLRRRSRVVTAAVPGGGRTMPEGGGEHGSDRDATAFQRVVV